RRHTRYKVTGVQTCAFRSFSRTPCQALQRLLLDPCGYARTTAGKVPILNLRAIVGIHVGAVQTPADYFSGIEFGAATPATWLRRVPPVSRKLDLDHTFG